jgi:SAM-dependent methyltransferase
VQLEALGLEVPEFLSDPGVETSRDTMVVDVEEMKKQGEAGGSSRPSKPRASTVALSDDDLEELVEPEVREKMQPRKPEAEPAARPAPQGVAAFDEHSSPSLPVVRFKTPDPVAPDGEETSGPATMPMPERNDLESSAESWEIDVSGPEHPIPRDTDERPAVKPPGDGVVSARADRRDSDGEEVALDDDDLKDEVATPADASDSGEILSDELIEEVEAQSAQPVPLRAPIEPAADKPAEPEKPKPEPDKAEAKPEPRADSKSDVKPEPKPEAKPEPKAAAPAGAVPAPAPPAPHKPPPAPPQVAHAKPPPAPPKKQSAARVAAIATVVAPDATRDERRRRAKPWFEEIFDEDYLRTLPFLTPQATQSEAQFVIDALGLQPGAQVLDLGCGYGRHAMELAARGFHVVGLDASLPLLLRGADEAQRRGLTINFVHGDMRELDFDSQFDGAYCVFSTFGFFDDETNKKTASNLARALKPGARIVLDILNRDYLIADLPTRVWWEGDGCVVLEEVEFNYFSSRIQCNRSVVFDDGRQVEQEISMRAYSLHEIGKLLHAAGFRVLEISGSMVAKGRFFGGTSRQIIVVAERRPKDPEKAGNGASSHHDSPKTSTPT